MRISLPHVPGALQSPLMNLSQQQVSPNSVRTQSPSHQRPYRCWKGINLNLTRFKVGCGVAALVTLLSLAAQAQEVIIYSHGFEPDDGGSFYWRMATPPVGRGEPPQPPRWVRAPLTRGPNVGAPCWTGRSRDPAT